MDRKAWITVTLCCILMGLNAWYMSKNSAERQKAAAIAAEAKKAEEAAKPAATADKDKASTPEAAPAAAPEETRELVRDSVRYVLSTHGGGVKEAVLSGQDQVVLNKLGTDAIGAFRRQAPVADDTPYKIVEANDKQVTFEGLTSDQLLIRKTYALTEGEVSDAHLLRLSLTLTNKGTAAHSSNLHHLYAGAAVSLRPDDTIIRPAFFWNNGGDANYKDLGYFSDSKTEFTSDPYNDFRNGGVMSRFYANIISLVEQPGVEVKGALWAERFKVAHKDDEFKNNSAADKDYGVQGAIGLPPIDLAPGASKTLEYEIYLGPKEYQRLSKLGAHRDQIMFYGWFSPISKLLVSVMRWLHDKVGNWGIAIVLLTVLIRTLLWPLQAKAQRSMKRMGKLSPLMKDLQTKYKDDPQRMNQEVMKLYREYGVNPVGGCLPMFLQIPIFFGFFSMLKSAAELRGQGFIGWVHDLSIPDTVAVWQLPFTLPFFGDHVTVNPLPLVMGLTMVAQMKLTPQPATVDKTQRTMMTFMPLMFLCFSYNYAAALALYWATSNIFMIMQTFIMKAINKDDDAPLQKVAPASKRPASPSMFSKPGADQKPKDKKPRQPRLGG